MNHKLSFHQEIARGKSFDENSVNAPGGIIVETEKAYAERMNFAVLFCKSVLGWAVHPGGGGGDSINYWVGMCRWDSETLSL